MVADTASGVTGERLRERLSALPGADPGGEPGALRAAILDAAGASGPGLVAVMARFARADAVALPDGRLAVLAIVEPMRYTPELQNHAAVTVSGLGRTLAQALVRCAGEAAEHLSQLRRGDEPLVPAPAPDDPARVGWAPWAEAAGDDLWTPAIRLHDGAEVAAPARLVYRFAEGPPPPFPLSIGCAAGPDRDAAALAALLEVVERDAVALWWRAGLPLRRVGGDGDPDAPPWCLALAGMAGLEIVAPVAVALSPGVSGAGLACAAAAGTSFEAAGAAARRELSMYRLGQRIALAKHAEGATLAAEDRAHLARAGLAAPLDAAGLVAAAVPGDAAPSLPEERAAEALRALARRLAEAGFEAYLVDVTRGDLGVPAARVLVPGLQPYPAKLDGARLARARSRFGGGPDRRAGIDCL